MMSQVLQWTQFDALICSSSFHLRIHHSYKLAGQKRVHGLPYSAGNAAADFAVVHDEVRGRSSAPRSRIVDVRQLVERQLPIDLAGRTGHRDRGGRRDSTRRSSRYARTRHAPVSDRGTTSHR